MDPQLQAAYREAYLAALNLDGLSDSLSNPSMAGQAAESATTLPAMRFQETMSREAGIFSLFINSLLASFLWSFTIVPALVLLSMLASLCTFWIFLQFCGWLACPGELFRDRHDDYAQDTPFILIAERRWHSFKRAMRDLHCMLRYNRIVDHILLFRQEMRIFYDKAMGKMLWVIPIGLVLVLCLQAHLKTVNGIVTVGWHELRPRFQGQELAFIHLPRKYEGSNSHYRQHQVSEPSKARTRLEDDVSVWCSACRQYHCCELLI